MSEMRTHFPDRPQFSGFMKPCRVEGDISQLEVYGEIPKEIDGVFYRIMPDPQLPPFIENDPVRNLLPQVSSKLTRESGSTGTAMLLPSASKTAEHPSGNGT